MPPTVRGGENSAPASCFYPWAPLEALKYPTDCVLEAQGFYSRGQSNEHVCFVLRDRMNLVTWCHKPRAKIDVIARGDWPQGEATQCRSAGCLLRVQTDMNRTLEPAPTLVAGQTLFVLLPDFYLWHIQHLHKIKGQTPATLRHSLV